MHNTLFKKLSLILISLIFSLIIVELLLRILGFHPWKYEEPPKTPEGMVCRFSDRIAYLTHDVEDAIRAGIITIDQLMEDAFFKSIILDLKNQ